MDRERPTDRLDLRQLSYVERLPILDPEDLEEIEPAAPNEELWPAELLLIARKQQQRGDLDGAIATLERAVNAWREPVCLNRLGELCLARGDVRRALHLFEWATSLGPPNRIVERNIRKARAMVTRRRSG